MSLEDFSPEEPWDDPFMIDTSVAHPARRYNYWLGGSDNFEVDRTSGDALAAAFPPIKIAAIENRRFLGRAIAYLAKEEGIRQFLDIGTGIPSADNVHEVAQSIAPESRVVYADNDPIVLAHARRLLARTQAGGATTYIHADLHDPGTILGNAELRDTLDLSKPVALMLIWVLHFLEDADDPYAKVTALTDALAPGSHLVVSHATGDFMPPDMKAAITSTYARNRGRDPFQMRNKTEFGRFFDGMELVPPGIQSISDWRNDDPPERRVSPADTSSYGAVARIR